MKLTEKILLTLLILLFCSIFISAVAFRRVYEKGEKGELYFFYSTILQQPFTHLVVSGGNVSTVIYEPAAKSSVRVFKKWSGYHENRIKAVVHNDTLYLNFPNYYKGIYEKRQLQYQPMVRLFSPHLKSVKGNNTNIQLLKLQESDLLVDIAGHSGFEVESLLYSFSNLVVKASDTTDITFEMSPALKKSSGSTGKVQTDDIPVVVKGWDAFHIKRLNASISGNSIIDVGHAQIDSIQLHMSDTSGIILSGGTLKKMIPPNSGTQSDGSKH